MAEGKVGSVRRGSAGKLGQTEEAMKDMCGHSQKLKHAGTHTHTQATILLLYQ